MTWCTGLFCSQVRFFVATVMMAAVTVVCSGITLAQETRSVSPKVVPMPHTPVIFDTDLGNDVDDALAMSMLHSLESRGYCRLIAVTSTKDHLTSIALADAINTFYGRPDVPLGAVRDGKTPEEGFAWVAGIRDNGKLRYPHDADGVTVQDAITVLRRALAAESDGSVVVIQVGFFTNLARLLDSPADDISPLTGRELVAKKVKYLSAMAGVFHSFHEGERLVDHHLEFNVVMDVPAAQRLAAEWPVPIVWSGFEIGIAVLYPWTSIERDFSYAEHHPCVDAFNVYLPPPYDRPTWDLTSVLYGVLPDRDYFELSASGCVVVEDDGFTVWTPQENGRDRYLILSNDGMKSRVLEALIQLATQQP